MLATRVILFSTALLLPVNSLGQIDLSDPAEAEAFQEALLEALLAIEGLRLDLNTAVAEDLEPLPWFSLDDARSIVSHRKTAGPFHHVRDLLTVDGLDPGSIEAATPYLTVQSPRPKTSRVAKTTFRAKGSASAGGGVGALRLYQRLQISHPERWELRVLHERDPGEGLADFISGNLVIRETGPLRRLVIGDFRPGFGQGLLLSRRGRSSTSLSAARPHNPSPVGYTSSEENGAYRGVFLEAGVGSLTWTAFGSRVKWDAKIDSTRAALRSGGEHVSETQLSYKDALAETTVGLRASRRLGEGRLGITGLSTRFSSPVVGIGPRLNNGSVDADARIGPLSVFGEFATASPGARAWVVGGRAVTGQVALTLLTRRFGPGYHALRAAPFASYSGSPSNEAGVFIGGKWRPRRGLRLEASLDRHHRIRAKDLPLPGRGERFRVSLSSKGLALQLTSQREDARISKSAYDREVPNRDVGRTDHTIGDRRRQRMRATVTRGSFKAIYIICKLYCLFRQYNCHHEFNKEVQRLG